MRRLPGVLLVLLAACGGSSGGGDDDAPGIDAAPGDRHEVNPELIPGGGVADAPIGEVLHVYVVDEHSGAPMSGATVQVGALSATTDAGGLASFDDAGLIGPQTVSATASGHAAATWVGVRGANVTIPLRPDTIPSAKVTGSYGLPSPPLGDYAAGVVLSTFLPDLASPENQLPQAMDGDTPRNVMIRALGSDDSSWELTTRTGPQRLYLIVLDGDPNGTTNDPSDDILTVDHYAVGASVTLGAGQTQGSYAFADVPGGSTTTFQASFQGAPSGLGDVVAFPFIDLGADGLMVLPVPPLTPAKTSTTIPTPGGDLAGSLGVAALATPPGAANVPFSSINLRNLASASATLPAWLALPSGLSSGGGAVSYGVPAGANVTFVAFVRADDSAAWTISVLDGSTSVTLPALAADPLAGESVQVQVTATEVPGWNPDDFSVRGMQTAVTRAAGARTSFNP
jgi:hypothetical protein